MKTKIVALLLVTLAAAGCTGLQARTSILIPSMELAWPGVRADAELGGAEVAMLDTFGIRLRGHDKLAIIAQWPAVLAAATRGIDARVDQLEVTLAVAESLKERLRRFSEAVSILSRRPF